METGKKNLLSRIDLNNVFKKLLFLMPVGVLGMFLLSYFTIRQDIYNLLNDFSYFYLLLAMLLSLVPWFTHTLRMVVWSRFLKLNLPFRALFMISLGTELGAAITPSAIGGGPVKAGMLLQQKVPTATSIFLTILGSAEDWIFFILVVPFSLLMLNGEQLPGINHLLLKIYHSTIFLGIIVTLVFLLVITLVLPSFWQNLLKIIKRVSIFQNGISKISKIFQDMKHVFHIIARNGKKHFVLSVFITSIQWISRYSITYLLLLGLGYHHNPFELFLLQVVVYLLMTFIPTPGSAIGAEASFYYIFQAAIPHEFIGFITTGWRLLTYYFPIVMASLIFMLSNYRTVLKSKKSAVPVLNSPTFKSKIQLT